MKRIGFATYEGAPELDSDDRIALAAMRAEGLEAVPVVWDRCDERELRGLNGLVLRSCWDYHLKTEGFLEWIERLKELGTPVRNPSDILLWNIDKSHLVELGKKGVALPRTVLVPRGSSASLEALLLEVGWKEAVIKPTISLSAYQTFRTRPGEAFGLQGEFEAMLGRSGVLLQEFVEEITEEGELSFIFFGRHYSHAVRKMPKAGDFRVQTDHGGRREPFRPSGDLIRQAEGILAQVEGELLYARVDGVVVNGRLTLMEIELIDPMLFLGYDAAAPERFARAIAAAFAHG